MTITERDVRETSAPHLTAERAEYDAFLQTKRILASETGVTRDPHDIHPALFPFQRDIVLWALSKGRAAIFADTGLGKTLMQLEWARQIHAVTGGDILILAPLAVAQQTAREGAKLNLTVTVCRSQDDVRPGVNIANYEMLHHFEPSRFIGAILDESSILKAYMGKTKMALIQAFASTPYRLCCTATPAPNDHMEIGNHAEFLGVMRSTEMLMRWFINDTMAMGNYRLKGHAEADFWDWVSSWAMALRRPSDLGYPDDGFALPPLHIRHEVVEVDVTTDAGERLFRMPEMSSTTMHQELRRTAPERAAAVARMVNASGEAWAVWCNTNYEADALVALIPDAVEVRGDQTISWKVAAAQWFEGVICSCQLAKSGKRTTARTIAPTGTSGPSVAPSSKRSTTRRAAPSTRETPSYDGASFNTSPNGESKIQMPTSPSDSSHLASPQSNIENSWRAREVAVPSAEVSDLVIARPNVSMLTMTTPLGQYEDSSARSATWVLENSAIVPNGWNAQHCICGDIKAKRVLISKPSVFGYGLNWQHCAHTAFVGLSYSYEDFYQAARRLYRFGQTRAVECVVVAAQTEGAVLATIERKMRDHARMGDAMVAASARRVKRERLALMAHVDYTAAQGRDWTLYHGDAVRVARDLPDASVGFSIFSPPFSSLYTYSDAIEDMGNSKDDTEFFDHFRFLIGELYRITMPGRVCAVHCKQLVNYKGRDGMAGLRDFRGEIIRQFVSAGWAYHSEVCIWKDPVIEMQRTKAHGLLYTQLRADSTFSRQGMAEYLLVFRRWPADEAEQSRVEPVTHTKDDFPLDIWQRYASPVWMDINQTRVLNVQLAREDRDEKHICPLQLDVIDRALELWTNPGDVVFSPFAGIGSEGVCSLKMGRAFVGIELKRRYCDIAERNLTEAARVAASQTLWDTGEMESINAQGR